MPSGQENPFTTAFARTPTAAPASAAANPLAGATMPAGQISAQPKYTPGSLRDALFGGAQRDAVVQSKNAFSAEVAQAVQQGLPIAQAIMQSIVKYPALLDEEANTIVQLAQTAINDTTAQAALTNAGGVPQFTLTAEQAAALGLREGTVVQQDANGKLTIVQNPLDPAEGFTLAPQNIRFGPDGKPIAENTNVPPPTSVMSIDQRSESAGAQEMAKLDAKMVSDAATEAETSRKLLPQLEVAHRALANAKTGSFADLRGFIANVSETFNLPIPEEIKNIGKIPTAAEAQLLQTAASNMIIASFQFFKGNLNAEEVKIAEQAAINAANNPKANQIILHLLQKAIRVSIERARKMREYYVAHDSYLSSRTDYNDTFERAWQEHYESNFANDQTLSELVGQSGMAPGPEATGTANPAAAGTTDQVLGRVGVGIQEGQIVTVTNPETGEPITAKAVNGFWVKQ